MFSREIYLKNLLPLLQELSSLEMQKEDWVEGKKFITGYWGEWVCLYYEAIGTEGSTLNIEDVENQIITMEEYKILNSLHKKVDDYINSAPKDINDYNKLFSDINWINLCRFAKESLLKLNWGNS